MYPSKQHKVVIIHVKSFGGEPPAPEIENAQHRTVKDMKELATALGILNDGDILVYHGHANKGQFAIGSGIEAGKDWKNLWKETAQYGLKKRPKLSCVFLASCMSSETSHNPLTHEELKEFRELFHARIAIAPNYEYKSHTGWYWGGKDELLAKEMISDVIKHQSGEIDPGEVNKRLHQYNERFGITYGCNGWNHHSTCPCGFGLPRIKK